MPHALHLRSDLSYNARVAVDLSFLKKIAKPSLSLSLFSGHPSRIVGIDVGAFSTKVVQLRHAAERATLETYGELINQPYLRHPDGGGGTGVMRFSDVDIGGIVRDVLRESNATARDAVFAIATSAAFVTTISFPRAMEGEIASAVPYEARKYVPIPISEVVLEWMVLESAEEQEDIAVLLIAVPRETIEKIRRVADAAKIQIRGLELESFSMARSLVGYENTPTLIINFGHQSTTAAFVERGFVRAAHAIGRGSYELTRALERGLGVGYERAEAMKREAGLSERMEEQEIASIAAPFVETLLAEIDRTLTLYNRKAARKIQKVNITGGGANLKGLVESVASKLGLEVMRGSPFGRLVTPPFLQPILKEIGPSFSAAAGAALREFTPR